ncbi:LAQU0S01e04148g1_1 [Lachancea quebecensis]|uniref:LAQU0S01e04148g1_1 n=1 Tax=Lachancea quebecensis TaxID=1654605 RepID=A0A0P1KKW0_9SACH|nr:LAQU0S01e04148g1_1 [Lachancea quebecensis]
MWKAIVDAFNGDEGAQSDGKGQTYDFAAIKKIVQDPRNPKILVDVREKDEYKGGHIEKAVNMPFRSNPLALSEPDAEFEKDFGFKKPLKDAELVFLCASGFRAGNARGEAIKMGYHNASIYPGSMNDWISKGGKTV